MITRRPEGRPQSGERMDIINQLMALFMELISKFGEMLGGKG